MSSPLSSYSHFPGETQDVFSNFFLTPLVQLIQAPVAIVRGNPYNTYQFHSYTKDNIKFVLNYAGNTVQQLESLDVGEKTGYGGGAKEEGVDMGGLMKGCGHGRG